MRVLFVVREFYPKPKASSICVQNVREALLQYDCESDVLMVGKENGIVLKDKCGYIYSVRTYNKSIFQYDFSHRNIFYHAIDMAVAFFVWPIRYPSFIPKYKKMVAKLSEEKRYDAIISTIKPLESVLACLNYPCNIVYEFDAMTNSPEFLYGVKKFFRYRIFRYEKKILKKSTHILHLECNREYYQQKKYDKYRKKFSYVDIPNLIDRRNTYTKSGRKDSERITFAYLGNFSKKYRTPDYLLSVIEALLRYKPIVCDFYSRGDCEDVIGHYAKKYKNVINQHGFVSIDKVSGIIENTDILISIGNKLSGKDKSIPSKTIDYMSYGKPILHIDGGKNDVVKEYLKKYGLCIVIKPNDNMGDNVRKIMKFLDNSIGKSVNFDKVKEMFPKTVPAYTANKIINVINQLEKDSK